MSESEVRLPPESGKLEPPAPEPSPAAEPIVMAPPPAEPLAVAVEPVIVPGPEPVIPAVAPASTLSPMAPSGAMPSRLSPNMLRRAAQGGSPSPIAMAAPFVPPPATELAVRPMGPVYDHLVEAEDDFVGLVAYGLYKRDKREWQVGWRKDNGAAPTAAQLDAVTSAQLTSGQRERYRGVARQMLDAYAMAAVETETPDIIRSAAAGRVEEAAERLENSQRWWRSLPAAFLGAALMVIIAAIVLLVLNLAGVDVLAALGLARASG
jgi:hypothetical protein